MLVADVGGRSIFVVRTRAGELRAFYNVCRHRGTQLLREDETKVRRWIRCPYHSWAYDYEGVCIGTPMFEDPHIPEDQQAAFDMSESAAFDRRDYGLLRVAVASWGPLVFANLADDSIPLADYLGDLPDRSAGYRLSDWGIARIGHYEVAANYKLVARTLWSTTTCPGSIPGW